MELQGKRAAVLVEQQYQEMEVWYPRLSPARGRLQGDAGRPRGRPDLSEQARLSRQERQGGQGRVGRRLRPPRHPRRLRAGLPAPPRGDAAPGQRHGRAGQGRRRHLPRPVGAVLDAGAQGQNAHLLLRHQGRRDQRRRAATSMPRWCATATSSPAASPTICRRSCRRSSRPCAR